MQNDRIIYVKGGSSNWYEQAIFIVKNNSQATSRIPTDLVAEAERIVSNYCKFPYTEPYKNSATTIKKVKNAQEFKDSTRTRTITTRKKNTSNFDLLINGIMFISCVIIAVALAMAFIN